MIWLRFLHFFGMAMWLGGGIAAMALAVTARAEEADVKRGLYRALGRLYSMVIGPGAALTLLSGLGLTMSLVQAGAGEMMGQPRIAIMQGAGVLGAALVLFVGLPTASKLAGIAAAGAGDLPAPFESLRKRQAIVSSIAGLLALVSLIAITLLR